MEYKDYYKIMGVSRDATQEEIKTAYRKLARKYHPDVSKEANAENKFKELGEAYEILKDPTKRKKYDSYGQYWQSEGGQAGQGRTRGQYRGNFGGGFADLGGASEFEDFLNSIFKGRGQHHANYAQGQDIHTKLNITLEDSFHGEIKTLQLQIPVQDQFGQTKYTTQTVKVKIPAGISDKQQIRLKGQGGKSSGGGEPGDLYIEVHFLPHKWFSWDKKNIHLKIPITPWEAVLGTTIKIPTLGGSVNLKIPKLSQTGTEMRLKGRGLPGHPPGDQFVTLQIVIEPTEDALAIKLYSQLASVCKYNPRTKLGID